MDKYPAWKWKLIGSTHTDQCAVHITCSVYCNSSLTHTPAVFSPQAASLPMSIIIVGVGPAEFDGKCVWFLRNLSPFLVDHHLQFTDIYRFACCCCLFPIPPIDFLWGSGQVTAMFHWRIFWNQALGSLPWWEVQWYLSFSFLADDMLFSKILHYGCSFQ